MKLIFTPTFVVVGLLFIGLAIPLMKRRIRPNTVYGLRVQATLADEWVWYEANAGHGRDLLYCGLCQVAAAMLLLTAPDIAYVIINAGVMLAGTIWVAAVGISRAKRLQEQHRESSVTPLETNFPSSQ